MYNENVFFEQLKRECECVLHNKSRCLAYEAYGAVRIAFELKAITSAQFIELADMIITNGINKPCQPGLSKGNY
nr:MAG TPA: hypothetical protein [Caudoviricetes sp.]